jgi:hypothetical protein
LKSIGSIQFLSKGAGEVFVEILVRTPPPLRGEFILTKPVTLSSNWETNILKLEEMTPNFDKGADFNDLEIKSISFKVKAVTSLWLDKIIIEGIKVSEFL